MKAHGRDYWEAHIKAAGLSGQSGAAYCRQHGLHLNRYYIWQQRLSREREPTSATAFVKVKSAKSLPVERDSVQSPRQCARLLIPCGAVFEFQPSTDPQWIGQILAELGGAK